MYERTGLIEVTKEDATALWKDVFCSISIYGVDDNGFESLIESLDDFKNFNKFGIESPDFKKRKEAVEFFTQEIRAKCKELYLEAANGLLLGTHEDKTERISLTLTKILFKLLEEEYNIYIRVTD